MKSVKIVIAHCERTSDSRLGGKKNHRIRISYDIKDRTHSDCTGEVKKKSTITQHQRTALSNHKNGKS